MATFFIVSNPPLVNVSDVVYQTAAGYVRAPHGAGVARQVKIFSDGLATLLANTNSTLPLGAFSVQYPGFTYTPVTVIVRGEEGENSTIDAHCKVFE